MPSTRPRPLRRAAARSFRILAAAGLGVLVAAGASANEGGSKAKTCPWAKEIHLMLGAQALEMPQTVFTAKTIPVNVGGFDIIPDLAKLKIVIVDPYSDTWEASLTVLNGGERCTNYYVGEATLVNSPLIQSTIATGAKTPEKPKSH
jgi:hypothetical protein